MWRMGTLWPLAAAAATSHRPEDTRTHARTSRAHLDSALAPNAHARTHARSTGCRRCDARVSRFPSPRKKKKNARTQLNSCHMSLMFELISASPLKKESPGGGGGHHCLVYICRDLIHGRIRQLLLFFHVPLSHVCSPRLHNTRHLHPATPNSGVYFQRSVLW